MLPNDRPGISWTKKVFVALGFLLVVALPAYRQPIAQATDLETVSSAQPHYQSFLEAINSYPAIRDGAKPPLIYAKAYSLIDAQTGEVIIEKNGYLSLPVASTTKMTTALVAEANLPLGEIATISPKVNSVIGSDIQLLAGEKMTVHSLLKGLLIQSGNDAAVSLAEFYDQKTNSPGAFVKKMNEFLRDHHIADTTFTDPAGLDDETGRSSAVSLAQIARILLTRPALAAIIKTPTTTIYSTDERLQHPLKNSNRLVVADNPYYMPEAIGVKTGFTLDAGHCLVAAMTDNGRTYVGVVLNTTESTLTASAAEMKKLFTWTKQSVEWKTYANSSAP
jgi:D-alanyl-D-alanine carboxypeptidase